MEFNVFYSSSRRVDCVCERARCFRKRVLFSLCSAYALHFKLDGNDKDTERKQEEDDDDEEKELKE